MNEQMDQNFYYREEQAEDLGLAQGYRPHHSSREESFSEISACRSHSNVVAHIPNCGSIRKSGKGKISVIFSKKTIFYFFIWFSGLIVGALTVTLLTPSEKTTPEEKKDDVAEWSQEDELIHRVNTPLLNDSTEFAADNKDAWTDESLDSIPFWNDESPKDSPSSNAETAWNYYDSNQEVTSEEENILNNFTESTQQPQESPTWESPKDCNDIYLSESERHQETETEWESLSAQPNMFAETEEKPMNNDLDYYSPQADSPSEMPRLAASEDFYQRSPAIVSSPSETSPQETMLSNPVSPESRSDVCSTSSSQWTGFSTQPQSAPTPPKVNPYAQGDFSGYSVPVSQQSGMPIKADLNYSNGLSYRH